MGIRCRIWLFRRWCMFIHQYNVQNVTALTRRIAYQKWIKISIFYLEMMTISVLGDENLTSFCTLHEIPFVSRVCWTWLETSRSFVDAHMYTSFSCVDGASVNCSWSAICFLCTCGFKVKLLQIRFGTQILPWKIFEIKSQLSVEYEAIFHMLIGDELSSICLPLC